MKQRSYAPETPKGLALAEIQRYLDKRDTMTTLSREWQGQDFSGSPMNQDVPLLDFQLELYPYDPFGIGDRSDALLLAPQVANVIDFTVYDVVTFAPQVSGVNYGLGACDHLSPYFDFSCVGLWVLDMSKLPVEEVEGQPVFTYKHCLNLPANTQIKLRLGGYSSHESEFTVPTARESLLATVLDDTHFRIDNLDLATLRGDWSSGVHKLMNSWPIFRNAGGRNFTGSSFSFVFSIDVGAQYTARHAYSDD